MDYAVGTIGRILFVRIDHGENPIEELRKLAVKEEIKQANITLLGATGDARFVSGPKEKKTTSRSNMDRTERRNRSTRHRQHTLGRERTKNPPSHKLRKQKRNKARLPKRRSHNIHRDRSCNNRNNRIQLQKNTRQKTWSINSNLPTKDTDLTLVLINAPVEMVGFLAKSLIPILPIAFDVVKFS
ncbi:hypothetical protein DRN85_05945 [Methanosarcinales archaeon]|nr:MAG: hypothetical protein DRN85_05945 [Methanosarcinales archaeon]